ncbi:hypothetical protein DPMN_092556 [Dreissena polymorpha]|uniref:Uncharacterized protein n=1 Tax=Dreissena polymorpha TaxID=45954 RepID=A0A9D4L290_DREPO|nr:hypothetical protein DPMN_092556 [Dreissena polymorpha]
MRERLYLMALGPLPCRVNPSVSHAYLKLQPGKLTFAHTLEASTPICTFWWYSRAFLQEFYSQSHSQSVVVLPIIGLLVLDKGV